MVSDFEAFCFNSVASRTMRSVCHKADAVMAGLTGRRGTIYDYICTALRFRPIFNVQYFTARAPTDQRGKGSFRGEQLR